MATKPCSSYAQKAAKPPVTPCQVRPAPTQAPQVLVSTPTPSPRKKKMTTPDNVAPGPTRKQLLLQFVGLTLFESQHLAGLVELLNKQAGIEKMTVSILSAGVAYKGYSLETSAVCNDVEINFFRGGIDWCLSHHLRLPNGHQGRQFWLGLPQSMAFLKVVNVPFFSSPLGGAPISTDKYIQMLSKSPLGADISGALKELRIARESRASSSCTLFFNIWDSQTGSQLKRLAGKSVMIKGRACRIQTRVGVPFCTNCCRWGHPSKGCRGRVVCPLCAGPHEEGLHCLMCALCKGNPKATPPVPPTASGEACPHTHRCANCKGAHKATNGKCPFWRHCRDRAWINTKYIEARNSPSPRPPCSNNPPVA